MDLDIVFQKNLSIDFVRHLKTEIGFRGKTMTEVLWIVKDETFKIGRVSVMKDRV